MFRFDYSVPFLRWAMQPPGYRPQWHVGVRVVQTGKLDHIRQGPVIWVDCADSQPCIGTAGSLTWHLKATGKLFHSGLVRARVGAIRRAIRRNF